jgi:hypothetical protein
MYKLYSVENRTETCGTPACMYLGVDISPSSDTLKSFCERNELINLIKLVENLCVILHYISEQLSQLSTDNNIYLGSRLCLSMWMTKSFCILYLYFERRI